MAEDLAGYSQTVLNCVEKEKTSRVAPKQGLIYRDGPCSHVDATSLVEQNVASLSRYLY
jgi:hypothetical protein